MDRIGEMKEYLYDVEESMLEERISMMKACCRNHEKIRQEITHVIDGVTTAGLPCRLHLIIFIIPMVHRNKTSSL